MTLLRDFVGYTIKLHKHAPSAGGTAIFLFVKNRHYLRRVENDDSIKREP
jgi:hypothetical protein